MNLTNSVDGLEKYKCIYIRLYGTLYLLLSDEQWRATMSISLGRYIKGRRIRKGMTQKDLAQRSGVTQATISNIEAEKYPSARITLDTLIRLAGALEVEVDDLVKIATGQDQEADDPDPPGTLDGVWLHQRQGPTEELIRRGNRLARQDRWREALLNGFLPAYRHLPEGEQREWFLVDPLAQTYINLMALDIADLLLDHAVWLRTIRLSRQDTSEFMARVWEKRGWVAGYRGYFNLGVQHFSLARQIAAYLEEQEPDEDLSLFHLQTTSYHFTGRLLTESQASRFYDALPLPTPLTVNLSHAIRSGSTALRRDQEHGGEINQFFDAQWLGRSQLFTDQWVDGLSQIEDSIHYFKSNNFAISEAEALINRMLVDIHRAKHNPQALRELKTQLVVAIDAQLWGTQYPYVVAAAYTTLAYCEFLLTDYQHSDSRRREGADMCELVRRIHPHPFHPFYQIADALLDAFKAAMSAAEKKRYENTLEARIGDPKELIFPWLDRFLHTSQDYSTHLNMIGRLIAEDTSLSV